MKNFFRKHWLVTLIFLGSFIFLGNGFLSYKSELKKNYQIAEKMCEELKEKEMTNKEQEYCSNLKKDNLLNPDFYMYTQEIILFRCKDLFYPLMTVLILLIPTIYSFKFINKKNKKELRKDIFKKAYQYIWLWPLIIGILLLICQYNAGPINHAFVEQMWQQNPLLKNHSIYSVCYLLNVLFYSILFINIALIVYRKQQNLLLTILLSVLLHATILVFADVGISYFFQTVFHSNMGAILNIGNGFYIYDTWKIQFTLAASFCWVVLTSIFVYIFYKDKEKLINDFNKKEKSV